MLDPHTYGRMKERGLTSIEKHDDDDAAEITVSYYDKESGAAKPSTVVVSLPTLKETRQKTAEELSRLDDMIADIESALGVKA